MGTDSNFVHSTTAHPPAGAGGRLASLGTLVRSVAAEGGTKNPVALYSEPHLLWRRLGTWSLKSLDVSLLPDGRGLGGCKEQRCPLWQWQRGGAG